MTQEQAKSELNQLYMSLSEEKKKALDVAFKAMEQADNIPVMYYPQVDGITPTVVAQANGEKSFKMRDATPEEQEAIDKYIKSISKPTGVNFWDLADGEYISKNKLIMYLNDWRFGVAPDETVTDVDERAERLAQVDVIYEFMQVVEDMPSVAIPNKVGHWIGVTNGRGGHKCDNCGEYAPSYQSGDEYLSKHCPRCGCPMEIER